MSLDVIMTLQMTSQAYPSNVTKAASRRKIPKLQNMKTTQIHHRSRNRTHLDLNYHKRSLLHARAMIQIQRQTNIRFLTQKVDQIQKQLQRSTLDPTKQLDLPLVQLHLNVEVPELKLQRSRYIQPRNIQN